MSKDTTKREVNMTPARINALDVLSSEGEAISIQEWASALGVSYTTATFHRTALMEAGMIESTPGRARSTKLTDKGKRYLRRHRGKKKGK